MGKNYKPSESKSVSPYLIVDGAHEPTKKVSINVKQLT